MKVLRWCFGIVGVILLGALGSGVWESLLGPATHAIARWILTVVSLGLTSYKNGVYQQVAADNQSVIALVTLVWVTAVCVLMMSLLAIYSFSLNTEALSEAERLLNRPSGAQPNSPAVTEDSLRQEVADMMKRVRRMRRMRLFLYVNTLTVGIAFVSQGISLARLGYVNSADAHYHYVMRVAAPYLDAHEQAEVEADFAQMSSRDDYVRVLSMLGDKCKAHGRNVIAFDPW